DPAPLDGVALAGRVEAPPQVLVLDRFSRRGAPAVPLPAGDPLGDAAAQILRVRVQDDLGGAVQGLERLNRRGELHAVVGGERFAPSQLLFMDPVAQDGAPAAGAGVAGTGPVGPDRDGSPHRMSP